MRALTASLVSLFAAPLLATDLIAAPATAKQPAPATAKQPAPATAKQPVAAVAMLHKLFQEGKLYRAQAEAVHLLKQHPNDVALLIEYGNILRSSGKPRQALQMYQRVVALQPQNVDAHVVISKLQLDNLDFKEALSSAIKAKTLDPKNQEARLAYIEALLDTDKVNDAERELQSMISSGSANPEVLHLAYEVKARKGDFEQSGHYLEMAIALSQDPTAWQIELADLEQRMNHPERARQVLRTILTKNPFETEARLRLARNLELFGGDFDAAIDEYRTLLEYDPDSASALTGIERCRAKKNNVALRIRTGLRSLAAEVGKFLAQWQH